MYFCELLMWAKQRHDLWEMSEKEKKQLSYQWYHINCRFTLMKIESDTPINISNTEHHRLSNSSESHGFAHLLSWKKSLSTLCPSVQTFVWRSTLSNTAVDHDCNNDDRHCRCDDSNDHLHLLVLPHFLLLHLVCFLFKAFTLWKKHTNRRCYMTSLFHSK